MAMREAMERLDPTVKRVAWFRNNPNRTDEERKGLEKELTALEKSGARNVAQCLREQMTRPPDINAEGQIRLAVSMKLKADGLL